MDYVTISPSKLMGNIKIPPSKSIAHRLIISAALSKGVSKIKNVSLSNDILATIEALKCIGCDITAQKSSKYLYELTVDGTNTLSTINNSVISMNESGSSLRFLIPVLLLCNKKVTITGSGQLPKRPLKSYFDNFEEKNIRYELENKQDNINLPLTLHGGLVAGRYCISGEVSSQFITGLMFALPLCSGGSVIEVEGKLQSYPYIDLTLQVLQQFGIQIQNNDYHSFNIKGNQTYAYQSGEIEGDYSQAAFYYVANALNSDICINGLNNASFQGDKEIINLCNDFKNNNIPDEINVSNIPDLVPILAVLYSFANKSVKLSNASRVRLKECDRLHAITNELNSIGGNIIELEDSLIINPVNHFTHGTCSSHNDHRIAMALTIAAVKATGDITINQADCIEKSYPNFYEDIISLGGALTFH